MQNDLLIPIIVAILAGPADGQQDAYPLHGQSAARQREDETACSRRASSLSGFDPANRALAAPVASRSMTGGGSRARGEAAQPIAGLQAAYDRAWKTCLGGRGYTVN